jgi:hypothetical protein
MGPSPMPATAPTSTHLPSTRARSRPCAARGTSPTGITLARTQTSQTHHKCTRQRNSTASRPPRRYPATTEAQPEPWPATHLNHSSTILPPKPRQLSTSRNQMSPPPPSTHTVPRPSTPTRQILTTQTRLASPSTRYSRSQTSAADGGRRRRIMARLVLPQAITSSYYRQRSDPQTLRPLMPEYFPLYPVG